MTYSKQQTSLFTCTAWMLRTFICLLMWGPLSATAVSTNYAACPSCGSQPPVWGEGEFDQMHLFSGAPAVNNLHPQTLTIDGLTKALTTVRLHTGSGNTPLLDQAGAARFSRGITAALAVAKPHQDALFLVTSGEDGNLLAARYGYSGRVFVDKNGLNLIFSEVKVDFIDRFRGTKRVRTFDFGSRDQTPNITLGSDNLSHPRRNWVVVPLAAINSPSAPSASSLPQAKSAPVTRDDHYYSMQEARLKSLKRLRDQALISDEEFQAKKVEILKDW